MSSALSIAGGIAGGLVIVFTILRPLSRRAKRGARPMTSAPQLSEDVKRWLAAGEPVPCDRWFEVLDNRSVRVRYSCGREVVFQNLPPIRANATDYANRIPDAPHPHSAGDMRWPR